MLKNPLEIAKRIDGLRLWDLARTSLWAMKPHGCREPYFFICLEEKKPSPVKCRIMLMNGWSAFHSFLITRQDSELGVAQLPIDFLQLSALYMRDGSINLYSIKPGYVPQKPSPAESRIIGELLWQCYGMLMRLEEDPSLLTKSLEPPNIFTRIQNSAGEWSDGSVSFGAGVPVYTESVAIKRDQVKIVKSIVPDAGVSWELDFVKIPGLVTVEDAPRFIYLFAAVEKSTGKRVAWIRLSVGKKGLLGLWEGLAQRLLDEIVKSKSVPGEICVRSRRLFRFLRPLSGELPFKLKQCASLPALQSALDEAIEKRSV